MAFFNINYDLVIEALLSMVENIGDFDVYDLPFENTMKENVENSVASNWRGKFSVMEKATWHLMDVGWTGVYMGLVYAIYAVFAVFCIQNKWTIRLSVLKSNLMQGFFMDQLPVAMITLSNSSIQPLNTLDRKLSFLSSLVFLSLCSYEFMRQYFEIKRLHSIKEEN